MRWPQLYDVLEFCISIFIHGGNPNAARSLKQITETQAPDYSQCFIGTGHTTKKGTLPEVSGTLSEEQKGRFWIGSASYCI